jgi:hypothetical protein
VPLINKLNKKENEMKSLQIVGGLVVISAVIGIWVSQSKSVTSNDETQVQQPKQSAPTNAKVSSKSIDINAVKSNKITLPNVSNSDEMLPTDKSQVVSENDIMRDYVNTGNPQRVMDKYSERRRARATMLQRYMDQQNSNSVWSEKLTQQFAEIDRVLPGIEGLSLQQADCRETICALHFDFENDKSYQKLAPLMASVGIVLGSDSFVHHDAKPQGAVMYLSQEDAKLPDLEITADG